MSYGTPRNEQRPIVDVYSSLGAQRDKDRNGSLSSLSSFSDSSLLPYARGWAWQHALLRRRLLERKQTVGNHSHSDDHGNDHNKVDHCLVLDRDCILFMEHSSVYTLGRGADENHIRFLDHPRKGHVGNSGEAEGPGSTDELRKRLSRKRRGPGSARLAVDKGVDTNTNGNTVYDVLADVDRLAKTAAPVVAPNGVPIYRIDRGGEVTYHGPGQLVCYPLLDLQQEPLFRKDLHWYLRMVEEVILETLRDFDIQGHRDEINTGVWVEKEKVAAVGVSSSRWITTHGFALNVSPDLHFFDTSFILPCGIEGRQVTSIAKILTARGETNIPSLPEVADVVMSKMGVVFGINTTGSDVKQLY